MPEGSDVSRDGSARGDRGYDYSHLKIPAGGKSVTVRNYLKNWSDLSEEGVDVGVEWKHNGVVDTIQDASRSAVESMLDYQYITPKDTVRLIPEPEMRSL